MPFYIISCIPLEPWQALPAAERVVWLDAALTKLENLNGPAGARVEYALHEQAVKSGSHHGIIQISLDGKDTGTRLDAALQNAGWHRYFDIAVTGRESTTRDCFIEGIADTGKGMSWRKKSEGGWMSGLINTLFTDPADNAPVLSIRETSSFDSPPYPDPLQFPWFDQGAYLRRIGYQGDMHPDENTLCALHKAHLLAIPFENLDIHLSRSIILDERRIFEKIVTGGRGGFCYELNGLFAMLLRSFGYNVTLLSAGVYDGSRFGPEFDHVMLLVNHKKRWLADVGCGESFAEPLLLDEPGEQQQETGTYRIENAGGLRTLYSRGEHDTWTPLNRFTLQGHMLDEFAGMCDFHQLSSESPFPRRWFCSQMTMDGRISITARSMIRTVHGQRTTTPFADQREALTALNEIFRIDLREAGLHMLKQEPSSAIPR